MPKIKVKNIPYQTLERICSGTPCGLQCPFYTDATVLVNNYLEHITCLRDARYDPEETVIELSEKEFPTNREWMESLSDEDLATFYTQGLLIENYSPYPINIHQIIGSFMASQQGIKEWLSKPCVYLMEKEL